ncbi:protein SCO1/2 [Tranquillimonas rosea]|uniref:Protein SCO1/2 n=1 Tax=Tranquillimonas rosea TaxID=641238 RepID=A0A1H9WJY6_9RHOB|nr:SCO family protein [Tranquillimonas rosea]SES34246.1 protein SCO1/2 [Tranquillimonas rosea]
MTRRGALRLGAAGAAMLAMGGCRDEDWYGRNVEGTLPDLDFTLTRASEGTTVTEESYRGQVVAMFFGFTFCPDICPMTLANLSALADRLGEDAAGLSILFVTVDPARDTLDQMGDYVANFTDRADGLRGTPDQLAALTRRLRVTYKVAEHEPGAMEYGVSHGKSVYVFGPDGEARVMLTSFDTAEADIDAAADDITRLLA